MMNFPFLLLANAKPAGLHLIDWILLILYGCSTLALGWYFGRKQKDRKEYFVGSGNIHPIFVGVSLFATLLSTISYLSMPGEALGKGPISNLMRAVTLPLVFLVVGFLLIPVYTRQRVTSAYELLETKLGVSVRLLGAIMFLILRLVWMSLLIYQAAKAMVVVINVQEVVIQGWTIEMIPLIVLITGFVSVLYSSLGGLRAVVVTDFMQTLLLFGGALLVIGTITWDFGGFDWFPTTWQSNWDTQPVVSSDPKTRVTVVGTILTGLTWYVATMGGDQTSVQRFMATPDAKSARRAVAVQLIVTAIVAVTLCCVGFALLSYYTVHPGELEQGMGLKKDADKIFPYFISRELPIGIAGLVMAGLFAAAMSSVDSGVNSITAVVLTDFLERFGRKPKSERGEVILARCLALGIGAVVVLGSSLIGEVPGNITEVTQTTVNLLTTPIFGLFFFALFVPFARPIGVWCGAICGILTAILIGFSGPLVELLHLRWNVDPATFGTGYVMENGKRIMQDPISFQWIGPVALAVNVLVGSGVSLLVRKRNP